MKRDIKVPEGLKANTTDYKRLYAEQAYDRISVTVPKGTKQYLAKYAASKGLSVNGWINKLMFGEMDREGEWVYDD